MSRIPTALLVALSLGIPLLWAPVVRGAGSASGLLVDFERFEDGTLYFKAVADGGADKTVKTDLYDLKYIGALRPQGDDATVSPYFLFSGRPCKDCSQDSGIYAIRLTGAKPTAYVYPGKILEPKSRSVVMQSQAFFGRCLPREKGQQLVVFQKERVDRRHGLQSSVFIATPGADHMEERLIERRLPRLQDTLRLVKAKACREIEGRNRIMPMKPMDIRSRRAVDPDPQGPDDDDDAAPKENQTDADLSGAPLAS